MNADADTASPFDRASAGPPWPVGVTALVLSGGSSRRLGRDKAATHVGGRRLLDRLLAGVPTDLPVVLVGPALEGVRAGVVVTREDPPGSGPLAAIGAGMQRVGTPYVAVVAADMPFALPVLLGAVRALAGQAVDAVVPVDADGVVQPLCAAYRSDALRRSLAALGPLPGRAVRAVLPLLRVMEWPVPQADLADVDTDEQLRAARARAAAEGMDMDEWISAVAEALGLDAACDVDVVLDVARDAAHHVMRPAAPVTTYLLGVAVGRGADPAAAAARVSELAQGWPGGADA